MRFLRFLLLFFMLVASAHAQYVLFNNPHQQYFDDNGKPLAGGRLTSYTAGTLNPLTTYQDSTGTTPNTNPIVLDSGGFATIYLDPTKTYKFVMQSADGIQQWSIDHVSGSSGGGGFPGGGGGASYIVAFTSQTTVTVPGSTHQIGNKGILVGCFDTATPGNFYEPGSYTVDASSYDVVIHFLTAQTGYCALVAGGSGSGTSAPGSGNVSSGSPLTLNAGVFGTGGTAIKTDNAISSDGSGGFAANSFTAKSLSFGTSTFGLQTAPSGTFSAEVFNNAHNRFYTTDATPNANTFGLTSLIEMLPSGSTGLQSKTAVIGWCQNDDTTANAQPTGGCSGVAGYGTIGASVPNGRGTGVNALSGVPASSDGTAVGLEADITNSSTEVTNLTANNVKDGIVIVSAGSKRATAGLFMNSTNPAANGYFYGVAVKGITPGGIPYAYSQAGNTTCTSTGIGSTGTCTLEAGSHDLWGNMVLTPSGTGIAAVGVAIITFSQQIGGNNPVCIFQLAYGTGGWQGAATQIVNGRSNTSYAVAWSNAGTVLSSGNTVFISYHCDGK